MYRSVTPTRGFKNRTQTQGIWCLLATVDFPTPPLADETAITFFTSRILRFSGNPRRRGSEGGVPERGRPYIVIVNGQPRPEELWGIPTNGFSCCKARNVEKKFRRIMLHYLSCWTWTLLEREMKMRWCYKILPVVFHRLFKLCRFEQWNFPIRLVMPTPHLDFCAPKRKKNNFLRDFFYEVQKLIKQRWRPSL